MSAKNPTPETNEARPFSSAHAAWFWAMADLKSRKDHSRNSAGICSPDDLVRILDVLYRQRRIDLTHARVLRIWGERGIAPDPKFTSERADFKLWKEAMDRLEWPLRVKGIVA